MADRAPILFPPPLALIGLVLAAWGLGRAVPLGILPAAPSVLRWIIGLPLIAIALVITFAAIGGFARARTPVNPYKAPQKIVSTGIYRYTRNPMYLGMVMISAGLTLLVPLDWGLLTTPLLWAALHYGVILREEPYLEDRFGAEYRALLANTRRWI